MILYNYVSLIWSRDEEQNINMNCYEKISTNGVSDYISFNLIHEVLYQEHFNFFMSVIYNHSILDLVPRTFDHVTSGQELNFLISLVEIKYLKK